MSSTYSYTIELQTKPLMKCIVNLKVEALIESVMVRHSSRYIIFMLMKNLMDAKRKRISNGLACTKLESQKNQKASSFPLIGC